MDVSTKQTSELLITLAVISIIIAAMTGWIFTNHKYTQQFLVVGEKQQLNVNNEISGLNSPVIVTKNIRLPINTTFNPMDYAKAYQESNDISSLLVSYGEVNTRQKGIYIIKYVIKSPNGLKADKSIQVVID